MQDGATLRCEGGDPTGDEEEEFLLSIVVSDEQVNRHPQLSTSPTLGGEPLPVGEGCGDATTLRWPASRVEAPLVWELGLGAREVLDARLEELQVAHVTTHGELDRYRSIVESETQPGAFEVLYRLPPAAEVPPEGLDVAFVFVVRDERGGVAWIRRSLCVTSE